MSQTAPRPFTIRVPDTVLTDLRARLDRVRWPDEIPGDGWRYGTDLAYMKELVAYWRDRYDWRTHEATLNELPQFTVPLGGIDLHFIHAEGVGPRPLPLLLSHGWPGSVWEFHRLIPLLTDPAKHGADPADAFTVVAPSLPGYGLSFRPHQPRFGVAEIADVFARLMTDVLGYARFGAQGGDWGAFITSRLGLAYADRLIGIHVTLLGLRRDIPAPANPTEVRAWSDCGGDVERRFTKDVLLTNVMLYWVTGAINSSFWPYYARRHGSWPIPDGARIEVPTAYASFPREILHQPRAWAERVFNIRRWTVMEAGGHFAALEEPEALAADIRAFFRELR